LHLVAVVHRSQPVVVGMAAHHTRDIVVVAAHHTDIVAAVAAHHTDWVVVESRHKVMNHMLSMVVVEFLHRERKAPSGQFVENSPARSVDYHIEVRRRSGQSVGNCQSQAHCMV